MKTLEIKKYPEEILRKICQPIEEVTPAEQQLLQNMLFTMHKYDGVGLAAPQVGIDKRLIVAAAGDQSVKLINPVILEVKGEAVMAEGCLSVPNCSVQIVRPVEIVVAGLDEQGGQVEIKLKDLMARIILHEIDHLQGKLITDYLSKWKRMMLFRKWCKV